MKKTCNSWRMHKSHQPLFNQKLEPYPATRFFDQLSFIGTGNVGCFVLETDEGFMLLDCMEPLEEHRNMIVQGIEDLGLNLSDLKKILVTHGHGDHYGCADWFREQTGCTIYMSEVDYQFAQHDTRNRTGVLTWEISDFYEDDGKVSLGSQDVYTFLTPGHSPGCTSFIFPVTDEGRPHMVALWGGTGVPRSMKEKVQYLESTLRFADATHRFNVDVEICSHPFVDGGLAKLDMVRSITDGIPNPFVIGIDNYRYYERQFTVNCLAGMREQSEKLES